MKLSALKTMVAQIEASAKLNAIKDPNVSFWLTSDTEAYVKGLNRNTIFVDVEPNVPAGENINIHRVIRSGENSTDFSIPLTLYVKESKS